MALRKDLASLFTDYFKEKDKAPAEPKGLFVESVLEEEKAAEVKEPLTETSASDANNLNNDIINLLKSNSELPPSITQDMLIKWCNDNFSRFDSDKPTQQQEEFMSVFSNQHFMDRLILGKGSADYQRNFRNYHPKGKKYIEALLVYGKITDPTIKPGDRDNIKPITLNNSLNKVRSEVRSFISAKVKLDEREQEVIKDLYTSPEQLFEAYFKNLVELGKTSDESSISDLQVKISKLNDRIIQLLAAEDISPMISQEMVIQWCTANFHNLNQMSLNKPEEKFLAVFINTAFLDRLILGKGSNDYKEKSNEYANQGLKFIEQMLMSGPPQKVNADENTNKYKHLIFPKLSHHLAVPRLLLDKYLSSSEQFSDTEKINIRVIQKKASDVAKIKWNLLQDYIPSEIYKNEEIDLNIKRLIYNDLRAKALKVNIHKKNDLEKLLSILPDTFDGFVSTNQLSGDSYSEIMELINTKAKDYLSFEKDIDIDFDITKPLPLSLKHPIDTVVSNAQISEKFIDLASTVSYILRSQTPLPDFVTREALLTMMFIDPSRLEKLKFYENEFILERLGDLDEVISLLQRQAKKHQLIGLISPDLILISRLREIQNKKMQEIDQYKSTLDEATSLLQEIDANVKIAEIKNHLDSQLKEFHKAIKDINLLDLSQDQHTAFTNYIKEIMRENAKNKGISLPNLMSELDNSLKELDKHFKSLKQIESYIKEQQSKNIIPDSQLQIALTDIHHKLIEIERSKERIISLQNIYKRNIDKSKAKKISNINKRMENVKRYVVPDNAAANKEMILYLIIMTRKSILEGNPTREYINEIYKNKKLNAFLLSSSSSKLKKKLNKIENALIKEVARQFKVNGQIALANTDKEYFTINPNTGKPYKVMSQDDLPNYESYRMKCINQITSEINACTDLRSRRKINSYWIKVMNQAYLNQDQFTLNIIGNALTSQNTAPFLGQSVYFKSSLLKLQKLLSLGKNGKEFLTSTEDYIKEHYDFVPDPSVFTAQLTTNNKTPPERKQEILHTFSNYHAYLQRTLVVAMPQAKIDQYASITNWLDGTLKPHEPVSITLSELGAYIAHRLTESIPTDILSANDDFRKILSDLPKCKTHHDLVSCLDRLSIKNQVHVKNIESLYHTISKHIELQKKEMLEVITNTPQTNMQKYAIKQEQLPEFIAIKMVDYLKLVQEGLELSNRNHKLSSSDAKQIAKINKLIESSIEALQKSPPPTFEQINATLAKLHSDLQKTTTKSSFLPQKLFVFKKKLFEDKTNHDPLSLIRNDMNFLNTINKLISYTHRDLQEKAAAITPTPLQEEPHSNAPLDVSIPPEPTIEPQEPEQKHPHNTSDIFSTLHVEPSPIAYFNPYKEDDSPIPSPLSEWHFEDVSPFQISGWSLIESKTSMPDHHAPDIAASITEDSLPPNFEPIEYEHRATKTHISESFQNNQLQVDVTKEPENYAGLSEQQKEQIDLMIAVSMVQLLVNKCGNKTAFEILDTNNSSRMRALILVCKANDLNVTLPNNHPFVGKPDELAAAVTKTKSEVPLIKIPELPPLPHLTIDPAPSPSSRGRR